MTAGERCSALHQIAADISWARTLNKSERTAPNRPGIADVDRLLDG
ncbi:hypothetical protein ACWEJ6_31125 [Nonomuraea sp. NPDC004702]